MNIFCITKVKISLYLKFNYKLLENVIILTVQVITNPGLSGM